MSGLSLIKAAAHFALASVPALVAMFTYPGSAQAQDRESGGTRGPLVLKEQGMFYVGGDVVHTDWANGPNNGLFAAPRSGDIAINQMYVTFMLPQIEVTGTTDGPVTHTPPQGSFPPRPRAALCRSPIIGQESGARAIRASLRVRNSCVGSERTGVLRSPPAISPKQRVERLLPPWQPDEARRADLPRAIARTSPRTARVPSLRKSPACGHEVLPWT